MNTPVIENLALAELAEHPAGAPAAAELRLPRDLDLIRHVQVALSARVGSTEISIEKLYSLRAGDVLTLHEQVSEPVTLFVENRAVARGLLVAVDDHLGIEISEILPT
jgi:flagellar motor switch protein FliN/FliY